MLNLADRLLWRYSRAYRRWIMRRSATWRVLMSQAEAQE